MLCLTLYIVCASSESLDRHFSNSSFCLNHAGCARQQYAITRINPEDMGGGDELKEATEKDKYAGKELDVGAFTR